MPNRQLDSAELGIANAILAKVRAQISEAASDDEALLFALRRKVYKELIYEERGKPMYRRKLKLDKRREQHGLCPLCENELPLTYAVLDRYEAMLGYTIENTRLICRDCDTRVQMERKYA